MASKQQETKASLDVLTVICKLFVNPITQPIPRGMVKNSIAFPEMLTYPLEDYYGRYCPGMWADPLIPYAICLGTKRVVVDSMPAVGINVSSYLSNTRLEYSAYGLQIKARIQEFQQRTEKSFLFNHMPSLNGPGTGLPRLLQNFDIRNYCCIDEAAIVRLLLLKAITEDPIRQVSVSDCPYLFTLNCKVKKDSCTTNWTPASDESDDLHIGTKSGTSTLFVRTLDEYAAVVSGMATEDILLNRDVVFIPVKSSWRGQSWLIPYILAFTTTSWWNHAVVINVELINQSNEKISDQSLKYELMPRAATVSIPGNFKQICLVVVDSTMRQDFMVSVDIIAKRDGEAEFALKVMSYLGRLPDSNPNTITTYCVTSAIDHFCEMMCSRNEFTKMLVRAAVLCTSRFCGYGVYPENCPPTKFGHRAHIGGLYQFNSNDNLMVADFKLLDIATESEVSLKYLLQNRQHWRTDPLGYFAFGNVSINSQRRNETYITPQYQLSESPPDLRILRACDVFLNDSRKCDSDPKEMFHYIIAYGSLTLGLTNWAAVELGVTIFEHNSMGNTLRYIAKDYKQLWPAITQDFVISPYESRDRVVDGVDYHEILGISMNLAVLPENIPKSWYDTHYSWNCPWWYVAALGGRFGHVFKAKIPRLNSKSPGYDKFLDMTRIVLTHSKQSDLSFLTQSIQYKKKFFSIYTPTCSELGAIANFLSWSPNGLTDHKKLKRSISMDSLDGICELNVVVFPRTRARGEAFVSNSNCINPTDPSTHPFIFSYHIFIHITKGSST